MDVAKAYWLYSMVIIGALSVALLLSGCCGNTGSVGAANPTPAGSAGTTSSSPTTDRNVDSGVLGTTYTIHYLGSEYEVTLTQAEFAPSSYSPASKYLMAYFEIKNVGTRTEMVAPNIYALDSSSEKYDRTIAIGVDGNYSRTLDYFKQLPPNTKMSGWIAIDVPENTQNVDLYFEYTNMYLSSTPNYIKYHITS